MLSPFSYSLRWSTLREAACAATCHLVGSPATFLMPALIWSSGRREKGRAFRVNAQIFFIIFCTRSRRAPAGGRTPVRGKTRCAKAKLHVEHSCSSGSCFANIYPQDVRVKRAGGRMQTAACRLPRPVACASQPKGLKHHGVKFTPGFPAH